MYLLYLFMSLSLSFSHLSLPSRLDRVHKEMNVSFYFSLALSQFLSLSLFIFFSHYLSLSISPSLKKEKNDPFFLFLPNFSSVFLSLYLSISISLSPKGDN